MLRGLDHLVIAVPDLADASAKFAELGFTVVPGGRHPVGTHNALVAFADGAYLELIAFYEANPGHKWWEPLQRGGGLVDYCLQTDDLRGDTAAFRRAGVDIADPSPLSRVRPDGYQLKWVLSIPQGPHRGVAPFLIEDETPRDERVPRQTGHANGVTGIGTLTVAVRAVEPVAAWYRAVLGQPGEEARRDDLDATGQRFRVGPHPVEILAPRSPSSALGAWVERRGEGPWAATLRTAGPARGPLDPARTLGARLTLE